MDTIEQFYDIGGPDALHLIETETPPPGAGEAHAFGADVGRFSPGYRVANAPAFKQSAKGVLSARVKMPETALESIQDVISHRTAAAFWMSFGAAYGLLALRVGLTKGAAQAVAPNAPSLNVGTDAFEAAVVVYRLLSDAPSALACSPLVTRGVEHANPRNCRGV